MTIKRRKRVSGYLKQQGVSLIEALGALAVLALISVTLVSWLQRQRESADAQQLGLEMAAWNAYAENFLLSVALDPLKPLGFALTDSNPVQALLLPPEDDALSPEHKMASAAQSRLLTWMNKRDQEGKAVNSLGQRYCLLLEKENNAGSSGVAAGSGVGGVLMTIGGQPLRDGAAADALHVMGPMGGFVGNADACDSSTCLTNGIGKGHLGYRYVLSTSQLDAIKNGCKSVLESGRLSLFLKGSISLQITGDPLYRIRVKGDGSDTETSRELNTMRHDLAVEKDIGFGLRTKKASTSCNSDDILARTVEGYPLQCNSSWSVTNLTDVSGTTNSGGSVAAIRLATQGIGLDGQGAITQAQMGKDCSQTGEFRRDDSGGVIGCQIAANTTVAKWSRMGAEEVRWKMFSQPILVSFDTDAERQERVLDLRSIVQASPQGASLHLEYLRLLLINVNMTPNPISNKANDSRQGKLCSEALNFYYGYSSVTDSDIVADVSKKCSVNLYDFFSGRGTGESPRVKFALLGYLCEGKNGCDP